MRQSCTILERNRIIIIFIFATIIFTYGYEGVISSFLTIRPPIIILETLRDLIENGYKIIEANRDGGYHTLRALLKKENISTSYTELIERTIRTPEVLSHCNTTVAEPSHHIESLGNAVVKGFGENGIKCHATKPTGRDYERIYFFFGPMKKDLYTFGCRLLESGILNMMHNYKHYFQELIVLKQEVKMLLTKKTCDKPRLK